VLIAIVILLMGYDIIFYILTVCKCIIYVSIFVMGFPYIFFLKCCFLTEC
jgi:hypothetical protein